MSILNYLKSLLPNIKKKVVLDDVRLTETELKIKSIPAWEQAEKAFRGKNMQSDAIKSLEKTMFSSANIKKSEGIIEGVAARLKKFQEILNICATAVEHKFEENTLLAGMTISKLNILRIVESANFASRYCMHLLNYIYIHETAAILKDENYIKDNMTIGHREWVEENIAAFCQVLTVLGMSDKKIEETLNELPDVVLGNDPGATVATLGESVVNPTGVLNFVPTSSNPIYHIGLFIAEYQANRYKEALDLKRVLELRVIQMENALKSKQDTKLEQQITYTQGRVDNLTEYLRAAQESYIDPKTLALSAHI